MERLQSSFRQALLDPERLSMAGPSTISGIPSGSLLADQGVSARGELSRPLQGTWAGSSVVGSPYVFAAAARGFNELPTAVEAATVNAVSTGVGLRLALDQSSRWGSADLGLEVAGGFGDLRRQYGRYNSTLSLQARF